MRNIFTVLIFLFSSGILFGQSRNLTYYLQQANKNSPLINKSENANKLLKLDKQQIDAILTKPVINIDANLLFAPIVSHDNNSTRFQWISEGADSYTGYDLSASDGGQYQAFVSVQQPLFTKSISKAYAQKNSIASKRNNNTIELTRHELEQLVSYQYLLCLKAKRQSNISRRLIADMEAQLKTMEKLVNHGIYKQTDLMILQIETENYNLEYQNYRTDYLNTLADLNLVCGINDSVVTFIEDTSFTLKPDTVHHSRFLKKYELDSMNIAANYLLFNQKYKPRVNLFATAGMNAIYLPSFNRFGGSTGINFTWNIFDGHQKQIQHNKSLVALQTLEFEKSNFIKKNQINKNKYLTRIKAVDTKIKIVENQLLQYNKLWQLYSYELSQAQVSVMDFKNLIRDIAAKQQENLLLKMEKQVLINSFNYWNF